MSLAEAENRFTQCMIPFLQSKQVDRIIKAYPELEAVLKGNKTPSHAQLGLDTDSMQVFLDAFESYKRLYPDDNDAPSSSIK